MPNYTEMTDTELRIEVAKRKGWTEVQWHTEGSVDLGREGTFSSWLRGRSPYMDAHAYSEVPDWLSDLNVAWALVEEMRDAGNDVELESRGEAWCFEYHALGYRGVLHPTPHRAIVCAWLEWVDQTDSPEGSRGCPLGLGE